MPQIIRLTLFKIGDEALLQEAQLKYSTLARDAQKDGKPYILAASANPAYDDPRSQGYTFAARTMFESKEDMDFYDSECSAHGEIKNLLKGKIGGPPLVVYMDFAGPS